MAALDILEVAGPFPKVSNNSVYRQMAATTDPCWTTELFIAATEAGKTSMARALRQGLRLHDLRVAAKHVSQALLGGLPQQLRSSRVGAQPAKWDTRPDLSWTR
jgi:hypothetical protein